MEARQQAQVLMLVVAIIAAGVSGQVPPNNQGAQMGNAGGASGTNVYVTPEDGIQNEPALAVDRLNENHLLLGFNWAMNFGGLYGWRAGYTSSSDGGGTWATRGFFALNAAAGQYPNAQFPVVTFTFGGDPSVAFDSINNASQAWYACLNGNSPVLAPPNLPDSAVFLYRSAAGAAPWTAAGAGVAPGVGTVFVAPPWTDPLIPPNTPPDNYTYRVDKTAISIMGSQIDLATVFWNPSPLRGDFSTRIWVQSGVTSATPPHVMFTTPLWVHPFACNPPARGCTPGGVRVTDDGSVPGTTNYVDSDWPALATATNGAVYCAWLEFPWPPGQTTTGAILIDRDCSRVLGGPPAWGTDVNITPAFINVIKDTLNIQPPGQVLNIRASSRPVIAVHPDNPDIVYVAAAVNDTAQASSDSDVWFWRVTWQPCGVAGNPIIQGPVQLNGPELNDPNPLDWPINTHSLIQNFCPMMAVDWAGDAHVFWFDTRDYVLPTLLNVYKCTVPNGPLPNPHLKPFPNQRVTLSTTDPLAFPTAGFVLPTSPPPVYRFGGDYNWSGSNTVVAGDQEFPLTHKTIYAAFTDNRGRPQNPNYPFGDSEIYFVPLKQNSLAVTPTTVPPGGATLNFTLYAEPANALRTYYLYMSLNSWHGVNWPGFTPPTTATNTGVVVPLTNHPLYAPVWGVDYVQIATGTLDAIGAAYPTWWMGPPWPGVKDYYFAYILPAGGGFPDNFTSNFVTVTKF